MNGKSNMDLLTQAITQRPSRQTSPPLPPPPPPAATTTTTTFSNNSGYNGGGGAFQSRGREDRSVTPPSTSGGDGRTNPRRATIVSQLQALDTDFTRKKDRYFHEQLRQLQEDLSRLHDGTHQEFNSGVSDLLDIRNEALYIAREDGLAKLKLAETDYEREIAAANEEYESTKTSLKNDLLTHLINKKKKLESDKTYSDISLSTTLEAPPSPSLMPHTTGSRKLRHRIPVPSIDAAYPPSQLSSKSALDEALETLAETIKSRHWKNNQQPQNEERVRDRIEREREKLVRSMLIGVTAPEADADVLEMKRKYVSVAKKSNGATKKIKT